MLLAATFSAMWISGYVCVVNFLIFLWSYAIIDSEAGALMVSGGCMAICITQVILCVFVIGLYIRKL